MSDAALVLPKVADALHMREAANEPLLQLLTRYLAGRQFLLVLDNCEHLLGACAELAKHLNPTLSAANTTLRLV